MMIGVPYNEPNTPPFELDKSQYGRIAVVKSYTHSERSARHVLKGELAIARLVQK